MMANTRRTGSTYEWSSKRGQVSVRIRIAGYNFDYKDFDQEKLRKLEGKNKDDFYARAAKATGQNKDLFEDIARGYLVTYDTAHKVRSFINAYAPKELHLGNIIFFPDHQRSKGRKPTDHEVIEPTLLAA